MSESRPRGPHAPKAKKWLTPQPGFLRIKAIHLITIGPPRSRTNTDVGPVIFDDIWFVVTRSDVHYNDTGIANGQSSSCEGRNGLAVGMHDVSEPVGYLLKFAADHLATVAYANEQTASARICKSADGCGEVPLVRHFFLEFQGLGLSSLNQVLQILAVARG